jgi:hypothetical protein
VNEKSIWYYLLFREFGLRLRLFVLGEKHLSEEAVEQVFVVV